MLIRNGKFELTVSFILYWIFRFALSFQKYFFFRRLEFICTFAVSESSVGEKKKHEPNSFVFKEKFSKFSTLTTTRLCR